MNRKQTFEQEVRPYIKELIRLAYTYVKDKQIAEDMIQDVLMKAYSNYDQFRFESKYKTYLYKMTINRCHDYLRSANYKKYLLTEKWNYYFKVEKSSEDILVEKEKKYELSEIVMTLKPIYREAILLHYYKQFTILEIAYLLDCSENTVKTRMQRAKNQLRMLVMEGGLADELRKIE